MPAPARTDEIDLVDDANRPVGTVRRGDALAVGANFRTVHVVLSTPVGRVVLQRLASSRERYPRRLGSSVAGYLHAGEDPASAAHRRAREELGVVTELQDRGVLRMRDNESQKFVGVFTGSTETYRNELPEQIAGLVELEPDEIRERLATDPDLFTPTFREVWAFLSGR